MDERPTDSVRIRTSPGGMVLSDNDLVGPTLMYSGAYVSDDGQLTIIRAFDGAGYSAARFTGYCDACARAGLAPPGGEPLTDVPAAVQFAAAHGHGDED